MITILKGDDSPQIEVRLAPGFDYTGRTVRLAFLGVSREFSDCVAGSSVSFSFFARETAPFPLGTWPVTVELLTADGRLTVSNNTARIRVTDDPAEVYVDGMISVGVKNGLTLDGIGAENLRPTENDSLRETKEKLSMVIDILKRAVGVLAVGAALDVFAVQPEYTTFNDAPGNAEVMTNVEAFVTGEIASATNAVLGEIPAWAKNPTPPNTGLGQDDVTRIVAERTVPISTNVSALAARVGQVETATGKATTDINQLKDTDTRFYQLLAQTAQTADAAKAGLSRVAQSATNYTDTAAAGVRADVSAVSNDVAEVAETVAAWTTYWDGDDVRLTVTNYYGNMDLPRLYLEQKIEGTDTYRVIWDEGTRHTNITARIDALEADSIPLRAWGFFDSHTGQAAPDGYASISASNIMIGAGLSYQKFLTAHGDTWVLTATEPLVLSGDPAQDAGFFKITDGDGNALFEIVKGDRRTVGAHAQGITVGVESITIPYHVYSDTHPTLETRTSLSEGEWKVDGSANYCNVTWSGASGNWIATVTPTAPVASMFFRAFYETGGETYVKHNVSHSADKLTVGGINYNVHVETVTLGGQQKKVLVLE